MILPVLSYGHRILRQKCHEIDTAYTGLEQLISNMWETLYAANGCGLAAPQINHPIRLFIVDSIQTYQYMETDERQTYFDGDQGIRETFINGHILSRSERTWTEEEGCLSIPGIYQPIERHWSVTIEYDDRHFNKQTKTFSGTTARMIQHEFDHTEGILHLDYLKPLTRKLLQGKLAKIAKGRLKAKYPMKYLK